MFSTLMIVSTEQGKLSPSPRSIGAFDAHLLDDIDYDAKVLGGLQHDTRLASRIGTALSLAGAVVGLAGQARNIAALYSDWRRQVIGGAHGIGK